MKIGDKVLVPRTGGGVSLGKIIELYTDRARVTFQMGETYRGGPGRWRGWDIRPLS